MHIDILPFFSMKAGESAAPNPVENADIESPGTFLAEIHQIYKKLQDVEAGPQSDDAAQKQSASGQGNLLSLLLGAAFVGTQVSDVNRPTGSGNSENGADAPSNAATSDMPRPATAEAPSAGGAIPTISAESPVPSLGRPEQAGVPSAIVTTDAVAASAQRSAPEKGGGQSKDMEAPEVSAGSTASAGEKSLPGVSTGSANAGMSGTEILSKAVAAVCEPGPTKSVGDKNQNSSIPLSDSPASQRPAGDSSPAGSSESMGTPALRTLRAAAIDNGTSGNKGIAGLQPALVSSEMKEPQPGQIPANTATATAPFADGCSGTGTGRLVARPDASPSASSPSQESASTRNFSEVTNAVSAPDVVKQASLSSPSNVSTGVPVVLRAQAAITGNGIPGNKEFSDLQPALVSSEMKEPQPGRIPANTATATAPFADGCSGTGTGRLVARPDASPSASSPSQESASLQDFSAAKTVVFGPDAVKQASVGIPFPALSSESTGVPVVLRAQAAIIGNGIPGNKDQAASVAFEINEPRDGQMPSNKGLAARPDASPSASSPSQESASLQDFSAAKTVVFGPDAVKQASVGIPFPALSSESTGVLVVLRAQAAIIGNGIPGNKDQAASVAFEINEPRDGQMPSNKGLAARPDASPSASSPSQESASLQDFSAAKTVAFGPDAVKQASVGIPSPALSSESTGVPVVLRAQAAIIGNGIPGNKDQAASVAFEINEPRDGQMPSNKGLAARPDASPSASSPSQESASLQDFSAAKTVAFGPDAVKQASVSIPSPALSSESTGVPVVPRAQAAITGNGIAGNKDQAASVAIEINEPQAGQMPSDKGLVARPDASPTASSPSQESANLQDFSAAKTVAFGPDAVKQASVSIPSPALSSESTGVPVVPRAQAAITGNGIAGNKDQAASVAIEINEPQAGQMPSNKGLAARLDASSSAISPSQESASLQDFSAAETVVFGPDAVKQASVSIPSSALSSESTGVPVMPRIQAAITENGIPGNKGQAALVSSEMKEPQPGQIPSNKAVDSEFIPSGEPATEAGRLAARLDATPPSSVISSSQAPLNTAESGTREDPQSAAEHLSFKRTEESKPPPEELPKADTDRVAARMDTPASLSASSTSQAPQHSWARWTKDEEPQAPTPTRTTQPNHREVQEGRENPATASGPESADKRGMAPLTGKTRAFEQDPEANHFFKQVHSDARGEGTSQLLSGPVASNKREMPVQVSAQGSGLRNAEFFLQIAEKFQILVRNGNGEIHIQLRPENLGRLDIRAEAGANGVIARIATESSSVKSYLENNIQALQQSFLDQGLKVERIDVLVHGGFDARNPAAHQQQSGNNGSPNPQPDSSGATPASSQRGGLQDEILVDPLTLAYLGPNSTFHTTA